MPTPLDKTLYNRVKREAKQRFHVWPSAYASGWVVKEYKRRGGRYTGRHPITQGLSRWFAEHWINVCKLPKRVPCGRPTLSLSTWKKRYPYCRPSKRISRATPKTASELSPFELTRRCKTKHRSPLKRILRKASRKASRNGSHKASRNASRKSSRKSSRKASRKASRKTVRNRF